MTTTTEVIKAIREALAHATPGAWVATGLPYTVRDSAYFDRVVAVGEDSPFTICRYTETTDAVYIAACNPVNIAALLARLDELEKDARRYEYVIDCDFKAVKKYFTSIDEQTYKAKRRAEHDAAIFQKVKS